MSVRKSSDGLLLPYLFQKDAGRRDCRIAFLLEFRVLFSHIEVNSFCACIHALRPGHIGRTDLGAQAMAAKPKTFDDCLYGEWIDFAGTSTRLGDRIPDYRRAYFFPGRE